jgi:hypothetical protein
MKTRCQSIFRAAYHSFDRAVFAGAVLLIVTSAPAQNLFVSDYISSGTIYEFTPGGAQSTYVSGLPYTEGLAFDSAGNLFVGIQNLGEIYKYTPGGVQSIFASGLNGSWGLAFDSAGDLFEADALSGHIYKFTPGGTRSAFASGLSFPAALAFNSAGNLFEADQNSGNIYEFTPRGRQSTFASGLPAPAELAFQGEPLPMPEPSALGLLAVGVTALLVRRRNLAV